MHGDHSTFSSGSLQSDRVLHARLERADAWRNVEFVGTCLERLPESRAASMPLAGGWLIYAWPGAPLNRGVALGIDHEVTGRDLDLLEEFYRSRGASPELDHLPFAQASLAQLLELRGYHLMEHLNVMARPIEVDGVQGEDERIVVEEVPLEEAGGWAMLVARGFAGAEEPSDADVELFMLTAHLPSARIFRAMIEGEDAGGGMLFMHDRAALLGATSVLPRFRRHGVHAALIERRIAAAAAAGCDLATTSTRPESASQRNMERHRFEMVYRKGRMRRDGG